uniref:ATEHD1 n=1 Tax=Arundo donax TaxID=35708 RepID=A0A0A9F578_ARUDO
MADYMRMNFGSPRTLHKFIYPTVTSLLRDVVQVGEQVILFFLEQLHSQWASCCLLDRLIVE